MHILVIARANIDHQNTVIPITADQQLDLDTVKTVINPYDEKAVVAAVNYKKQVDPTAKIYIASFGSNSNSVIRSGLARGGDEGLQFMIPATDDDLIISHSLVIAIKKHLIVKPDLIFMGVASNNDGSKLLPSMLAFMLSYHNIFNIEAIEYNNSIIAINHYQQQYDVVSPAVISVSYNINKLSFLKLPDIIAAKKKNINKIMIADEDLLNSEINNIKSYYPDYNRQCQYLDYQQLLDMLKKIKDSK